MTPGLGEVAAGQAFLDGLDDFVAVAWRLGDQRKHGQAQSAMVKHAFAMSAPTAETTAPPGPPP